MIRKEKKNIKLCPLLDRDCLKQGCEIHNGKLDRCDIGLLAYNLYVLAATMQQNVEKPE